MSGEGGAGDRRVATGSDRALGLAENIVYAATGLVLVAGAVVVLAAVSYRLAVDVSQGASSAVTGALDGLLLVFILLELLAGVRATIVEHRLVAEPFLVAGIIASIKEIIVVSLSAKKTRLADPAAFDDAMIEIAVLGGIVLLLSLAAFLVRRKEREPEEEDSNRS